MGGGGSKEKPEIPSPRGWPSAPSAPSYNSPSSLSAIKTYNVNNTIPLNYNSVSLNNFGPCENEGCTKYETVQETCGKECVKYRTECRGVYDWRGRSRKAVCRKVCVKTEPKMCDTQKCVERKCTKRKSINELNGMEIPQIHERIEKMKNIVNVHEQNSKIVMENFEKSIKDKLPGCFGKRNGDCNRCSWKVKKQPGYPCNCSTCGKSPFTYDCNCDWCYDYDTFTLSNTECEVKKSLTNFACNAYEQLAQWKC